MDETPRAFLDASVLYPVSLRHLLMRLALASLFQPQWSAHVHEEWIRSVLRDNPHIPAMRLWALRDAMDQRIDDAVVTGYEHLVETLTLPDPDDRHVLAAAITGGATVILTRNLRDFPPSALKPHGITAWHPDPFIRRFLDVDPESVIGALRDQQASLINPPIPMSELLGIFERIGLAETVAELRRLLNI
jgi:hypothetical protein